MKSLLSIICNNGLGHTRRVLSTLNSIVQDDRKKLSKVGLCVDPKKADVFTDQMNTIKKHVTVELFPLSADVMQYENELKTNYGDLLSRYDCVWSDNLVFPLSYRDDTVLTGSFLWLDILDDTWKDREKEILNDVKPKMIGSTYFATPAVRNLTRFIGVGMYNYFSDHQNQRKIQKKDILVAFGKSESGVQLLRHNRKKLDTLLDDVPDDTDVYIEPAVYGELKPRQNLKKADFSLDMYKKIAAAIIRPGMGTLSDVLATGGRVFCVYEGSNFEMEYNAERIQQLGIGQNCMDLGPAFSSVHEYLNSENMQSEHKESLNAIKFSGVEDTATSIKEVFDL